MSEPDFRDEISTVHHDGKRKHIYAWKPSGKFYNIRTYLSYFYFLLFFGLPFIYIHGNPLFEFNIPESTFIIFGKVFTPEDFAIFGMIMLVFLIIIVLFTVIFGRVFCGWACPQTIFLEMLFRKIEYAIEGSAAHQRKLNEGPKDNAYFTKKTIKHVVFLLLSFLIANTFLAYIIGAKEVIRIAREPLSQHLAGFISIVIFTLVFYSVFAFVRELVCTVVCPYGRLQGVLLDKNSIVVAYDHVRGEPRGKGGKDRDSLGDCVDCHACVRVCPTGIDIRNGTQLECVNCTACIDACDDVMEKVHLPKGLIRYASENEISEGKKFKWTNRMKFYTFVLVALSALLTIFILNKSDLDFTVIKVPGQVMQENADGTVSNLFRVIIDNKTRDTRAFDLKSNTGQISWVGEKLDSIAPLSKNQFSFFIKIPQKDITKRRIPITLDIMSGNEKEGSKEVTFIGEY